MSDSIDDIGDEMATHERIQAFWNTYVPFDTTIAEPTDAETMTNQDTPTPPDTDLTYCAIEACVRSPDHADLVLSPDRQYEEFTDAEQQFHRGLNKTLGACDIPDPVRVGDYYGIVLDDRARQRFEADETYTPEELVDVCVALFEDVRGVTQALRDIFAEIKNPTPKRLSLISPGGESVETSEVAFATYAEPFTAICMAEDLPAERDLHGWDAVCSKDGEVVFSGVVDAVRGPDEDGVVEMECAEDDSARKSTVQSTYSEER